MTFRTEFKGKARAPFSVVFLPTTWGWVLTVESYTPWKDTELLLLLSTVFCIL